MSLVSADTIRLAMKRTAPAWSPPLTANHWLIAALTGEGVAFAPTTTTSQRLDPSGQVRDSILTGGTTTGPVNFEVSRNPWFDEMLEAVIAGAWGGGTWSGAPNADTDRCVPAQALHMYVLEKRFKMPDDSYSYHRYSDCAVQQMAITITPGEPITGNVTIAGGPLETPIPTAELGGQTYVDPGDEPVMTAPLVTELTVDTGTVSAKCFGTFSVTINNNTRGIQCIGTLGEREKVLGRVEVTLAGTVYYASNELLEKLKTQDAFPVTLTITDSSGGSFTFDFPRCKLTQANVVAGGTGQDVVVDMSMQALYDSTATQSLAIVRSAPALPAPLTLKKAA